MTAAVLPFVVLADPLPDRLLRGALVHVREGAGYAEAVVLEAGRTSVMIGVSHVERRQAGTVHVSAPPRRVPWGSVWEAVHEGEFESEEG